MPKLDMRLLKPMKRKAVPQGTRGERSKRMLLTAVYLSGGDTVDLEWIMKRFDVSRSVAKDDIAKLRKIVTLTTERTGVNVRVRYRMEPDNG